MDISKFSKLANTCASNLTNFASTVRVAIAYEGVAKTNLTVYSPKTIQTKPDFFSFIHRYKSEQ
jgi:hypothetical protein